MQCIPPSSSKHFIKLYPPLHASSTLFLSPLYSRTAMRLAVANVYSIHALLPAPHAPIPPP